MANNVVLEYEKQWSYWLTLKASDGTNSDTILVKVRVVNVPEPKVRMWVQDERPSPSFDATNLMHPSASGGFIGLYAVVHNLPCRKASIRLFVEVRRRRNRVVGLSRRLLHQRAAGGSIRRAGNLHGGRLVERRKRIRHLHCQLGSIA